ncbi:hypothetical protein [Geobacter sp. AOG1]|uniref:hypothetical protein n=1 Tax=Geobacter sp. AOG1 TaxID=1566346 RepID=UPI001CC53364|nr:hypothetical protein [Geobacter sp. AOG1]GFE57704.1 hypothetical protein AOG1_15840 [Geobacter sp. AOG1]
MKRLKISLFVGVVCVVLSGGALWGADQEQPANEPATDSQQAPPELPYQPQPSPSPPPSVPGTSVPDVQTPPEPPPEAPADPCKGCVCSGAMVTPACLECCR